VIGDSHKGETLYFWGTSSGSSIEQWLGFGDEETQPKYQGQVKDGKPNGLGILYNLGGKYIGEWKDGIMNGQGINTTIDGDRYVGGWKNGLKDGQGTETWSGGGEYVGEWENGMRNGQGTFTIPDWSTEEGEYKDNRLWNGTTYDKNGKITGKYVNGKKIKQ
jgi:hypothetical protein